MFTKENRDEGFDGVHHSKDNGVDENSNETHHSKSNGDEVHHSKSNGDEVHHSKNNGDNKPAKVLQPEDVDSISAKDLMARSARGLFLLEDRISLDHDRSKYRKEWLEGIIKLKYRDIINDLLEETRNCLSGDTIRKENSGNNILKTSFIGNNKVVYCVKDNETVVRLEFVKISKFRIGLKLSPANS
ncbi:hypothetical protein FACS1894152_5410 [Bacilli bacterium]|nr:hypothetical protein FACS1894152_5410 [Bacilli bacterium]